MEHDRRTTSRSPLTPFSYPMVGSARSGGADDPDIAVAVRQALQLRREPDHFGNLATMVEAGEILAEIGRNHKIAGHCIAPSSLLGSGIEAVLAVQHDDDIEIGL